MKTQRNLLVALTLILAAAFTTNMNASTKPEAGDLIVKIEKSNAQTLGLRLANLNKKFTKIRITDLSEKIWLTENVTNEYGYAKKINLSGLPSGEYLLFIENRGQKYVQAFAKNDRDIAFFQKPTEESTNRVVAILTSTFAKGKKGELITRISTPDPMSIGIQLANLDYQKTTVQLNYMYCTPALKEMVEGQAGYAKKINLTGMEHGGYYFIIKVGEITQVQFFSIDKNGVQLEESQMMDAGSSKFRYAAK